MREILIDDARRLHDTVIGTLAAIAAGSGRTRDIAAVRAQCARDATAAERILNSSDDVASLTGFDDLLTLPVDVAIRLDAPPLDEVERYGTLIEQSVLRALLGAAAEAIRNADRHAGVDVVDLRLSLHDDEVRVTVSDNGVGFDPTTAGFGVTTSILRRSRDAGVDVGIRSAIGEGTTVSLSHTMPAGTPLPAAVGPSRTRPLSREAAKARARWRLAGLPAAVGLLRQIADGTSSPSDPAIRRRCARTEADLHAALLIDPDLVLLGPWLAVGIARARAHGVALRLRGGAVDAPDPVSAAILGTMLLTVIRRCPEGESIVIGIFGTPHAPVYTVTGPPRLGGSFAADIRIAPYAIRTETHGDRWLATVVADR